MEKAALYHRAESEYAYLYTAEEIHIRFRSKKDDVDQVWLHYGDSTIFEDSGKYQYRVLMRKVATDDLHDYWRAKVQVDYRRLLYLFEVTGKDGENVLFGDLGVVENLPQQYSVLLNGFRIPYLHDSDRVKVPAWVKETCWYQIFPERFANGNPNISPVGSLPWNPNTAPANEDFFGGDLYGVLNKLDYLAELGITGLYFCPIFEAPSNHKYDTIDYFEIDRHFGDKAIFRKLVQEAHRRGMKVMLDAVFNHIGNHSPQWQDVIKNGEQSVYRDWFYIHHFPVNTETKWTPDIHLRLNYDTFAFRPKMPKLNTANPQVKQYLLDIAAYWIKEFDIDAWRLDVANEIDHQFWKEFHKTVTAIKPDIYILGEIWHSARPWLNGDEFHGVMNYPLANSIKDYFLSKTILVQTLQHRLNSQAMFYRQQTNEVMFNMLDSHDTERILTVAKGNKNAVKSALAFMYLHCGTPCIYYGTEVGMTGSGDPDCRRVMPWDKQLQDQNMLEFMKELIAFRKAYQEHIIYGERQIQVLDNQLLQVNLKQHGSELVASYNSTGTPMTLEKMGKVVFGNMLSVAHKDIILAPDEFVVQLIS